MLQVGASLVLCLYSECQFLTRQDRAQQRRWLPDVTVDSGGVMDGQIMIISRHDVGVKRLATSTYGTVRANPLFF